VYLVVLGGGAETGSASSLAESLRDKGVRVELNCGGGGLKTQLKRADRSGARLALLLGPDELARGAVSVKDLRGGAEQATVALDRLDGYLRQKLV
jgi:histidyl-tRNA synthetase